MMLPMKTTLGSAVAQIAPPVMISGIPGVYYHPNSGGLLSYNFNGAGDNFGIGIMSEWDAEAWLAQTPQAWDINRAMAPLDRVILPAS